MKKELDDKLCKNYPEIFKDRHAPMTQTCMCWGFACDDGWYNLIDRLCASLSGRYRSAQRSYEYCKQDVANQPIEKNLVRLKEAEALVAEEQLKLPLASQVKEKFGTLHFYVFNASNEHYAMIGLAENISSCVCEICGAMEGTKTYTNGWYKTLCPIHAKKEYGDDTLS